MELRRHLLGAHAWSWSTLGSAEDRGRRSGPCAASQALLAHERYYGGRARDSLSVLPLDPEETRTRLAHALEVGARLLVDAGSRTSGCCRTSHTTLASAPLTEAIEQVTAGYRYVPEPEAERVLLVPHVQPEPWLVLAQHRGTRLIVYQARAQRGAEGAGRGAWPGTGRSQARRDPLARGTRRRPRVPAGFPDRPRTLDGAPSPRRGSATRLIDLEGNARAYRYLRRQEALEETLALLSEVLPRA